MKVVNTNPDLRTYKSEGRILTDQNLLNQFIITSLNNARNNKELIMDKLFINDDKKKLVEEPEF